jgi:LysM repeat protein
MIQITHEQAQAYLQAAADQLLDSEKRALLDSHLESCGLCQAYARGLDNLETTLRSALRNCWNATPIPLSVEKILGRQKKPEKFTFQRVLQFAGAPVLAIAVVFLAILLGVRHFSSGLGGGISLATVSAEAIPTPSAQLTTASTSATDCVQVLYKVQAGDTLETIARKFSVPKETIMEINGLKTEDISAVAQLTIPLCDSTPSLTPTITMTYTLTPYSVTASRTP